MSAPFLDWLAGASFYIGYARYAQFVGHEFVVASAYDNSEELRRLVEELDAGDIEALDAAEIIKHGSEAGRWWYATDRDPAVAMVRLVDKMRQVHQSISAKQDSALRNATR